MEKRNKYVVRYISNNGGIVYKTFKAKDRDECLGKAQKYCSNVILGIDKVEIEG